MRRVGGSKAIRAANQSIPFLAATIPAAMFSISRPEEMSDCPLAIYYNG